MPPSPTPTIAAPTPTGSPNSGSQVPPINATDLVAWLEAGNYLDWPAEGLRPGSASHFNNVRTFVNDALFASLDADAATHPLGAAAVKELYGGGTELRGWAVSVKIGSGSTGSSWYWLEYFNNRVLASGVGITACTGCHAGGTNYFCTPFPLQAGGQALPALCP